MCWSERKRVISWGIGGGLSLGFLTEVGVFRGLGSLFGRVRGLWRKELFFFMLVWE